MPREIQPESFAFAGETHRFAPLRQGARGAQLPGGGALLARQTKQVVLTGLVRAAVLIAELHRARQAIHQRSAVRTESIEAARAQQRLEHAAVDLLQIEAAAQLFEA